MFGSPCIAWVALFAACFVWSGCAKNQPPPKTKIALVADSRGFADRSFNAAASAGIADCAKRHGIEVTSAAPASAADYESQLALLATQNFDAVIAVGDGLARDLDKVARRFESTRFAIIGGVVDEPNVASITFKEQDGSFLAGALAALVTRSKSVAFLGGVDTARLHAAEAGFAAGAREVDPRVTVRQRFVGSFEDERAAQNDARALYAGGTDIVYVVAGRAGLGALAAAREPRAGFAIGADSDQAALAPGKVLASVVKRVDRAALRACLEALAQKPVSGRLELGFAEGGLELAGLDRSGKIVGVSNMRRLQRMRHALEIGTLKAPATPDELAGFKPVPIL